MRIRRWLLSALLAGGLGAALSHAQEDKFASCPDPEAARRYVKECLATNPYNTREICEERALEKLCAEKK